MPVGNCVLWPQLCCLNLQAKWVAFSRGSLCLKFKVYTLINSTHSPVLRDWKLLLSSLLLSNTRPWLQAPFIATVRKTELKRELDVTWWSILETDVLAPACPGYLLSVVHREISYCRQQLSEWRRESMGEAHSGREWSLVLDLESVFWNGNHLSFRHAAFSLKFKAMGSSPEGSMWASKSPWTVEHLLWVRGLEWLSGHGTFVASLGSPPSHWVWPLVPSRY